MKPLEIKCITKPIDAEVTILGSKSYTNRALIIAALSKGESTLNNVLYCDDTRHMMSALRKFGVEIKEKGTTLTIIPPDIFEYKSSEDIYLGNAGTAMRFLTGLCSLVSGEVKLIGNDAMHTRPIEDLVNSLSSIVEGSIEALSTNDENEKCPPVVINSEGLRGGTIKLKGDTSSQYLSSIMMVAPYAKNDIEIEIDGDLTSKSYIDMTIDIMRQFGVKIKNYDYKKFVIKAGQEYEPRDYTIECDASNMSYPLGAAAVKEGSRVRVNKINPNSVQGDIKFPYVLKKMGCEIDIGEDYIGVIGPKKLQAIEEIDMNSMPDTVQTLAFLAAIAEGTTKITNISNLEKKETKRISALVKELKNIGIKTESTNDSLTIYGGIPHGAIVGTHGDHRMAMGPFPLGLVVPGIIIEKPSEVSKSWPTFFEDIKILYN